MKPHTAAQSPLGQASRYPDRYDPTLLFALPRASRRSELGIGEPLPFVGADLWSAYELSWLNPRGKPQVALAQISIDCHSSHMVESKSFKLYLNSFNQTRFDSAEAVRQTLRADLAAAIWGGAPVRSLPGVRLLLPPEFASQTLQELDGLCLDRLDVECQHEQVAPELLRSASDAAPVHETLLSHLLKSNCQVTGQPDWASVQIAYSGPAIDQAGLLQYLVSYRLQQEFHEPCVERIYTDLMARCRPSRLFVYARYTRRGGIDINPWRSSHPRPQPVLSRSARQ
ncbi:NADPH-dependent 7-cyano-7-deazaguanine reductase QueF [Hydrogenophaga sp.]|uniref:NADPH-dependent 7-cyano-7-deazaguanine reductase QueF n=1 Tax=Hydrogenophaga sp. TaxID=1904254 RepID=UPI00199116E2|nr:NADPH-dependent 7-cyano-7-deazaguanine reductase QueF [Hydrogenophaga sp.]MBD3893522.1 NADPH-dependent 7-cyano-7-deazaguanine reductase QueF [Hydrogenophaga sp.]